MAMGPLMKMVASDESSYCSSNVLVIDEPDSTTTGTTNSPTSQIAMELDEIGEDKSISSDHHTFSKESIRNDNIKNVDTKTNNSMECEAITIAESAKMVTTTIFNHETKKIKEDSTRNFIVQQEHQQYSYYQQQQTHKSPAKDLKSKTISSDYDRYDDDNETITTTTIDDDNQDDASSLKDKDIDHNELILTGQNDGLNSPETESSNCSLYENSTTTSFEKVFDEQKSSFNKSIDSLKILKTTPSSESALVEILPMINGKTVPVNTTHIPASKINSNDSINKNDNQILLEQKPQKQQLHNFMIGEDVFIKKKDERFYLGTIIENIQSQQYRIRFDDNTELWCKGDEIRKLRTSLGSTLSSPSSLSSKPLTSTMNGSTTSENSSNSISYGAVNDCLNNNNNNVVNFNEFLNFQPMCVVCKRDEPEMKVERCERCGRGYHYRCTLEASPNTDGWWCKRCSKPMKLNFVNSIEDDIVVTENEEQNSSYNNNKLGAKRKLCFNLPYKWHLLHWDKYHRVNEEQIYCYCGKSGCFDQNMLQCCRCLNWYHTNCIQIKSPTPLLRGDGFFVFSCSVCNQGPEFLRRLQMSWIDVGHLILYNLSSKKHYNQKYHHLLKEILPFSLQIRHLLSMSVANQQLNDEQFKDCICKTLKENHERFICGREGKRDNFIFGLRQMAPPLKPEIKIRSDQVLNDTFLIEELKLPLQINLNPKLIKFNRQYQLQKKNLIDINNQQKIVKYDCALNINYQNCHDIYEFHSDDEEFQDNTNLKEKNDKKALDYIQVKTESAAENYPIKSIESIGDTVGSENIDNDSSEDEIPIKHIMEKVKKQSTVNNLELLNEDDNANDAISNMDVRGNTTTLDIAEKHIKTENTAITDEQEKKQNDDDKASTLISHNNNSIETKTKELSTREERPTRNSRKRKTFSLSTIYNDNSYDYRLPDPTISSDDNSSSSSRGGRTSSLDIMIPPPKNFFGQNNPFRMITPKKQQVQAILPSNKHNVINGVRSKALTTYNLNTKLETLKKSGIFTNLNANHLLGKGIGQQRTVRTVKRKLSAKDIKIGPNQEVKRRRTRRSNTGNVEVISTTTIINPMATNILPINNNFLTSMGSSGTTISSGSAGTLKGNKRSKKTSGSEVSTFTSKSLPPITSTETNSSLPAHGRRLRQRPQRYLPNDSRRSSASSNSTLSNNSTITNSISNGIGGLMTSLPPPSTIGNRVVGQRTSTDSCRTEERNDLTESVTKYFGVMNRIKSGEQFTICAKRRLPNGQIQYLIEWGETIYPPFYNQNNKVKSIEKSSTE